MDDRATKDQFLARVSAQWEEGNRFWTRNARDAIFNALPAPLAVNWAEQFLAIQTPPVERSRHQFLHWLLSEFSRAASTASVQARYDPIAELHRREAEGQLTRNERSELVSEPDTRDVMVLVVRRVATSLKLPPQEAGTEAWSRAAQKLLELLAAA